MRRGPETIEAPAYILTMREEEFQKLVIDTARTFGWEVYHIRNMRANEDGFPDLQLFRGDDYILAELKTATGTVSAKQRAWAERLSHVEAHYALWRPADWPEIRDRLNAGRWSVEEG